MLLFVLLVILDVHGSFLSSELDQDISGSNRKEAKIWVVELVAEEDKVH